LFARDPNAFTAASEALSQAEIEKAEAEERWLELELLREELEG
jgi:ATP-binding cassette subfamily F protein uup